jgi:hypothetical protein
MKENDFWEIIDKSCRLSRGSEQNQIVFIGSLLNEMGPNDIIDFEEILCHKIIESDDYKIVAAAKIINGYVSDDSYLYFRCWLIGKGKAVFDNAIKYPDSLAQHIEKEEIPDFEELLYVSTDAYSKKIGEEENDTFPRNICIQKGLNYNYSALPTKGKDWTEKDLPFICPNLFRLFSKR